MCTFMSFNNQSAALAEFLFEAVVALLHISNLCKVALIIVEWVDGCLPHSFDIIAIHIIIWLLHFLLMDHAASARWYWQPEFNFVNVD